jgi:C1A family cysteine protease
LESAFNGFFKMLKDSGLPLEELERWLNPKNRDADFQREASLPTSFDARTKWPSCVFPVRNQQSCGSCWAFSSSAMLEDRYCIASNGATKVRLAP